MRITKLLFLIFLFVLGACDFEDQVPERPFYRLSVNHISQVNESGATFTAEIVVPGSSDISEYGFVWNTTSNPNLNNSFSIEASNLEKNIFSERVERDLLDGETYFVKAYLKAGDLIIYSTEKSFDSQGSGLEVTYSANSFEGSWGDTIQIVSTKFTSGITNVKIRLDESVVSIIEHNNESIGFVVPKIEKDSVPLSIEENGVIVFEFVEFFKFLKPRINRITPRSWNEFDTITILGENFTHFKENNILKIEDEEIEIIENSKNSIKFIAPILETYDRKVDLILNSSSNFIQVSGIDYHPPLLTEMIPNVITSLTDTIIFKGLNFGRTDFWDIDIVYSSQIQLAGMREVYNPNSNTRTYVPSEPTIQDYENIILKGQGKFTSDRFGDLSGFQPTFDVDGIFEFVGEIDAPQRGNPTGFKIGDNYFYGLGSSSNSFPTDFWKYDIEQNTWEQVSNFISDGRVATSIVTLEEDAYIGFGRRDFTTLYDDIYRYTSSTDSWALVSNYPNGGIYDAGLFMLDDQLFVAGGRNPNEISDAFKYSISNDAWLADTNFPEAGELEVIQNGQDIFGLVSRKIYQYKNNSWSLLVELQGVRFTEGHISNDDLILVRRNEIAKFNISSLSINSYTMPIFIASGLPFGKSFVHNDFLYLLSSKENNIWRVELSKL